MLVGFGVRDLDVREQRQRLLQRFFDQLGIAARSRAPLLGLRALTRQPLLLGGEHVLIHHASVVQVQELLLLLLQLPEPPGMPCRLITSVLGETRDVAAHRPADRLALVREQANADVVALDGDFDLLGGIWRASHRSPALPLEAAEVLIGPTVAAIVAIGQPRPAVVAEHGPLEVVRVLARPVAAEGVRSEDLLDAVERSAVDQRLVPPLRLTPLYVTIPT